MPLINTRGAASIKGFGFAGFSPTVPGAPTSVSASATSCSAISVSFTAPACNGGLSIDYYQAVCTGSGTHSATGSSPISITGLCASTSYTFKVRAHNSIGYGCYSSSTGTATTNAARGNAAYTTPGSYTWNRPTGVTRASVVAVGGGQNGGSGFTYANCCGSFACAGNGGSGSGLGYLNNYCVSFSSTFTVVVANHNGNSYFYCSSLVHGQPRDHAGTGGSTGGLYGCGRGVYLCGSTYGGGGGGAGGYSGTGGQGGIPIQTAPTSGCSGGGGGGTSCHANNTGCYRYYPCNNAGGGGGGGVGIYGQGSNGSAASGSIRAGGGGGSGGANGGCGASGAYYQGSANHGGNGGNGGSYGGGGGGGGGSLYYGSQGSGGTGASGAVRIVWPGCSRQFPSTDVS